MPSALIRMSPPRTDSRRRRGHGGVRPALMPAFAAPVPSLTRVTSRPSFVGKRKRSAIVGVELLDVDAQIGVVDAALGQELHDDVANRVDGNGEADADVADLCRRPRRNLCVHADHLARSVESGPPELPSLICASVWMTRSIGVSAGDSIVRCKALTIPAVTERSSPSGFRSPPPSRRPGRAPSPELERRQRAGVGVDLQQRDVGGLVVADDLGLHALLVREADLDVAGHAAMTW